MLGFTMRYSISYSNALVFLLLAFGALYIIEVGLGITFLKDLWVNLVAALVVVLVIDKIVEKSKLRRTEQSIFYAKQRIFGVLSDLVLAMRPPDNWQERLEDKKDTWSDFYERIWKSKEEALHTLEALIDSYYHLIGERLTNDVLEMIDILSGSDWTTMDPNWLKAHELTYDEGDLLSLSYFTDLVAIIICQAVATLQEEKVTVVKRWIEQTERKPPKVARKRVEVLMWDLPLSTEFEIRKESIEFKDKCAEAYKQELKEPHS